jgi:hypothetical protein
MQSIPVTPTMPRILSILKTSTRHRPYTKRPPLTGAQRRARKTARSFKSTAVNNAVANWHAATLAKAEELSRQFGFKPRYFLDRFFHGGAHMLSKHSKVSPWRAFLSKAAAEENSGSSNIVMCLMFSDHLMPTAKMRHLATLPSC